MESDTQIYGSPSCYVALLGNCRWGSTGHSLQQLAERFPDVSMTHIYSGFIANGLTRGMPLYLRWIFLVVERLFAVSPADCGEWMMYALVDPAAKTGAHFKDNHAEALGPSTYAQDETARTVVWKSIQERSDRG
ncbi:hypothetical protein DFH09DRAFT_1405584 [Mycena vulgaris]|nr:hypothetical protein DFH09DRAFT_1405584 [Mycena vulgaris]